MCAPPGEVIHAAPFEVLFSRPPFPGLSVCDPPHINLWCPNKVTFSAVGPTRHFATPCLDLFRNSRSVFFEWITGQDGSVPKVESIPCTTAYPRRPHQDPKVWHHSASALNVIVYRRQCQPMVIALWHTPRRIDLGRRVWNESLLFPVLAMVSLVVVEYG